MGVLEGAWLGRERRLAWVHCAEFLSPADTVFAQITVTSDVIMRQGV